MYKSSRRIEVSRPKKPLAASRGDKVPFFLQPRRTNDDSFNVIQLVRAQTDAARFFVSYSIQSKWRILWNSIHALQETSSSKR
jgi:hypothetical protein